MALDILNGKVRVYNYEMSPVGFPSQHSQQGVFIRGREEDEEFVVERVALDDIEIENSKSDLFKVGRLRFHPDEEDEVYKKLGIEDKENILSDKQLRELLLNDSIENVKRISSIKSSTLLTRMKHMLFAIERTGKVPPPTIVAVVSERSSELRNGGKRNPDSQINKLLEMDKKEKEESKLKETVEQLLKKVEALEKEKEHKDELILKSQTAIENLLVQVENLTKNGTKNKEPQEEPTEETKKSGRPPKSSK